jgi:hypothetical protein
MELDRISTITGRPGRQVTRRDVARCLLGVPAAEALASLPALRRQLVAAGNPLTPSFWQHAEAVLGAIAAGAATRGQVQRWLEATGTEPTAMVGGGFVWRDEAERGPVATDMHARLVAHLEELVASGEVDPDRLLARDPDALASYEALQVAWLHQPQPDGRQPIWAVSDEEDDELLAAWDDADADARQILAEELARFGTRECPDADLARTCRRLRRELAGSSWPYDVLAAAAGVDPDRLPDDDRELWLTLAAGVVACEDAPPEDGPLDDGSLAAWFALDHAAWIGAVVSLVGDGPGAPADADTLAQRAAGFDFEASDGEIGDPWGGGDWGGLDDDAASYAAGFSVVAELWHVLGAVDDRDRLTPLGWWGLPEALERAWRPDS